MNKPVDPLPNVGHSWITYLRYAVQCEMFGGYRYYKDPQKQSEQFKKLYHKCAYNGCQACFIFLKSFDSYYFVSAVHHHDHSQPEDVGKYHKISIFLRPYMKHFIENDGDNSQIINECYSKLGIPQNHNYPFFAIKQDTLNNYISAYRKKLLQLPNNGKNPYSSFDKFVKEYTQLNPDDIASFTVNEFEHPSEVCFIFADSRMIQFIQDSDLLFHIDSTYKIIFDKLVFYVLSTKLDFTHVIPLLYFAIKPDTQENISLCLQKFFTTFQITPKFFMSDCALQIFNGIKITFPNAQIFWCALYVMRALRKNLYRLSNEETRKEVDKLMNNLCYTRDLPSENAERLISEVQALIMDNEDFNKYFTKQWLNHCEQWISSFKEGDFTFVNNVSEAFSNI